MVELVYWRVEWRWQAGAYCVEVPKYPKLWFAGVAEVMTFSAELMSSHSRADAPGAVIVGVSLEFQTLLLFYVGFVVEGLMSESWHLDTGKRVGSPVGAAG